PRSQLVGGGVFDLHRAAERAPAVARRIARGARPAPPAGSFRGPAASQQPLPRHAAALDGHWPRHLVEGWCEMWDYATPIIAQVHGYCLAGGSELATACDLVYVAEDAKIGYPPVRTMSPPDMAWQPWMLGMRRA